MLFDPVRDLGIRVSANYGPLGNGWTVFLKSIRKTFGSLKSSRVMNVARQMGHDAH